MQVTSDVSDHSPPFSGVDKKSPLDPTFPAKKTAKMTPATIGGFPETLICERIIHYINTVP